MAADVANGEGIKLEADEEEEETKADVVAWEGRGVDQHARMEEEGELMSGEEVVPSIVLGKERSQW